MSDQSLIGVLNIDGVSYHARPCLHGGGPTTQVPRLAAALQRSGDLDELLNRLLMTDWFALATHDHAVHQSVLPAPIRPEPGIGFAFAGHEIDDEPLQGYLGEVPPVQAGWAYLVGRNELLVLSHEVESRTGAGYWSLHEQLPLAQLRWCAPEHHEARERALRLNSPVTTERRAIRC